LRSSIEQAYFGTSQSGGSTTSSGQAASAGTSVGVGNQSQDAKRLGGSAGVNLGLGAGGASAGGGLDGSIGQSKTRIDAADFAKKYVDDKSFRSAVDSAIKGSVDQSEGTQGSASQRSGTGVEGALNETREAGRTFGEAQARRQSAETRNQEAQSAVASAAVNGGAILVAAIGEDGAIRLATAAATQPSGVSGALDTARNAGNSAFLGAGGAGSKGGAVPAPESGQFDALTQRVDGATANARAIIANGDASARAFAADAMQRAGIPVDTSVVAPQFASQVQALQTAAASGNAEAARAIAVMTERGYLQFEKSYNNPLPSGGGPTYQQMPPAPPRESAPPAARPR
jgi:hypothetical protein